MQDGQTRVQPYRENERKPRTHSERPGRGLGLREQSGRELRVGGGHGRGTAAQGREPPGGSRVRLRTAHGPAVSAIGNPPPGGRETSARGDPIRADAALQRAVQSVRSP